MRQSQLFTRALREAPKDEISINSQFLIRAGFIDKLMAGVYSFLPLGLIVLSKIEKIISEEMEKIGGQRVLLPALHPKENWTRTGRWAQEEMFKLKNRQDKDFGLGWTHEEIITPLVQKFVRSHKDLPVYVYQIQDKFRDELRVKSGLLRGTEFIMKDLYSFHADEKDLDNFYEKAKEAYFKIFKRCGLGQDTFLTLAAGGTFAKYSHEFQTVTPFGEDEIHLCPKCSVAVNREIIAEHSFCPQCQSKSLEVKKAIEVGNIFKLKEKYTQAFNFKFKDKNGQDQLVLMGCYGIGLSRLMGAVAEVCHDENGVIWPREVAPFQIHLMQIGDSPKVKETAEKIYQDLQKAGVGILYDDREVKSTGERFAEADLIGIPLRVVVSEKTLKENCVEFKKRSEAKIKLVKIPQILKNVR